MTMRDRLRSAALLLPAAAFLLLSACASIPPGAAEVPLERDPEVRVGTLPNGLTYMIRHNAKPAGRVELRLAVNVGSVLEADDQQGLAHLLEHMAFNGTERFEKQEIVNYLQRIGMRFGPDLNAYTSFDETVYMLQVPTDSDDAVRTGFEILRDWAFGVLNEDEEIAKERGVVIEEWRLRRGADQRIRDRHLPVLFKDSRYADRLPIGTIEVLETFEPQRVRDFYADWYRPDLMGVLVVGDLEPDAAERLIREQFGDRPAAKEPREREYFPMPDHGETLVSVATDPEATDSSVGVYFKHEPRTDRTESDYRQSVVENLFVAMLNTRFDELRQRSDAPFVSASGYYGNWVRTAAFFGLSAQVPDNGILPGLEALLAEAERVRRHGFMPAELERAKAAHLSAVRRAYNERDTTESRQLIGGYVRDYLWSAPSLAIGDEMALTERMLPAITLEDVNALAGRLMESPNRIVLASGPDKDGVYMPEEAEILARLARMGELELAAWDDDLESAPLLAALPPPGFIVGEDRIEELGVTTWRLSNGARVVLKPTEFKQDQILLHAFRAGGSSVAADEQFIPASSAAQVVDACGLGDFSRVQLQKLLAGRTVSVVPYIEELKEGVRGESVPADLGVLFDLVHLSFTAPREDADAFASLQKRLRADLENRLASPEAAFGDQVVEIMSGNHPRRKPWTPETVDEMDMEASLDFYRGRFSDASEFTFVLVGNLDLAALRPLVESHLASLPSTRRGHDWRDVGVRTPEGEIELIAHLGMEPKAQVLKAFSGPFEWTYAERHALRSMLDALNILLREEIREKMSGTYSIYSYPQIEQYPRGEYTVWIAFGCDPAQAEVLSAAVDRLLARVAEEPVEESYVVKVRQSQLREREVQLERNEFWSYVLSAYLWSGEDPLILLDFPSYVEGVSAEGIREAAKRFLGTENHAEFRLLPAE